MLKAYCFWSRVIQGMKLIDDLYGPATNPVRQSCDLTCRLSPPLAGYRSLSTYSVTSTEAPGNSTPSQAC